MNGGDDVGFGSDLRVPSGAQFKPWCTAIEYGLIAALIAVAIIVAVTLVGTSLQLTFNAIAGHLGSSPL